MYMHDSMQQLQLQVREPTGDYSIGTRDQFIAQASWHEGRPFPREEVGVAAKHDEDDGDNGVFF